MDEDPPPGGSHNDPARMIGNGAVSAPNVARIALARDEMLVLMSDGVHRHVDVSDIGRILHAETPLARRCLRLVEAARSNGSVDDATVLLLHRSDPDGQSLRWRGASAVPFATERSER